MDKAPETMVKSLVEMDAFSAHTIHPNASPKHGHEKPPKNVKESGALGATAFDPLPEEKGEP